MAPRPRDASSRPSSEARPAHPAPMDAPHARPILVYNGLMKFGHPPRLLPLPSLDARPAGVFWRPTPQFVWDISRALAGARVLEIFAGNGYLAGVLSAQGVDITATSILSSMDAHAKGLFHPVDDLDAREAIARLGGQHDLLLMCWPTVTNAAIEACRAWGDKPILYIGEFTDYSKNHLGGCATDRFFSEFIPSQEFDAYQGNMLERACLGKMAPPAPAR